MRERVEAECVALAAGVDPADPLGASQRRVARTRRRLPRWLRAGGARPAVCRLLELGALGLAGGSSERLSLLGQLRVVGAAGAEEVYGYERWEGLRLVDRERGAGAADGGRARRAAAARRAGRRARRRRRAVAGDARRRGGAARRGGRLRAAGRPAARRRDHAACRDERLAQPAPPASGARREGRRRIPGAGLARCRLERAGRLREHRRVDLAAGRTTRSRCWSRPSGSRTSSPRRRSAAATRCSRRSSGSTARPRGGRTRCSSAPGASTRSRSATSRSGRRATSRPSARCTARTSRRSTSAAPTTGWRATWRVRSGRAARPRWRR